jgi:protein-S-isoprenylcysteine O-methyltransferase Ste14
MTPAAPDPRSLYRRVGLRAVAALLVLAATLFGLAGRLDWLMAWLYLGLSAASMVVLGPLLIRHCPELVAERLRGFRGTAGWDRVLAPVIAVAGPFATLVVAALDRRFAWSPELPLGLTLAALLLVAVGQALILRSMWVNRFFVASVRIQEERGHRVVDTGPYRMVRHPGYLGAAVAYVALAPALDSLWALVPAGITLAGLTLRAALEDRMLRRDLPGYADYARRVRYRLLPGIW